MDDGNIWMEGPNPQEWDKEAAAALIDALQCHRDTGSFGALADTSAVPFVGKRMRHASIQHDVIVLAVNDGYYCYLQPAGKGLGPHLQDRERLLPLVEQPKPKVRPFYELANGEFFRIEGDSKQRTFQKHITTPFDSPCATDMECRLFLFKNDTPCLEPTDTP
jgi:hypothetical protein